MAVITVTALLIFFPMGIKGTGSGIVNRKSSSYNGKTRGTIRKPGTKSRWQSDLSRRLKSKKKSMKRKRTSTKKKGSFKKAKKIRTTPSKFAKRHYDDYGSVERDHCAYIGFQRHGCKDRMWSIIGEAVTKALLAKIQVYPRSYDEQFANVTNFDSIQMAYKRVAVPGGTEEESYDNIAFSTNTTFEALSELVTTSIKSRAERTDDADNVYAYYPIMATFYHTQADNRVVVRDLGESVVQLYATQVITVKNLTPNDGGTSDLDVVGVNPIHGKKYEFNNFRPKLIDSIEEQNADLGAFYEVDDTNGINFCQLRDAVGQPISMNEDHIIAHPPVPCTLR